jgi:epsin
MDLNSLKDQVSNLTLYDLKAGFRKAQNGRLQLGTRPAGIADARQR